MSDRIKKTILHKAIFDCISYFLYGSIKETGCNQIVSNKLLKSHHLRNWYATLERCDMGHGNRTRIPEYLRPKDYAKYLSEIINFWSLLIHKAEFSPVKLPESQTYQKWFISGGSHEKYWPVHKLKERMDNIGKEFFIRGIVHGSISTLDDKPGFSDMDLAFIIRKDVITNSYRLVSLRKLAVEILSLTYGFDPFMHHGPYYLSEIDVSYYPESFFPPILFSYGLTVFSNENPIFINPVRSEFFSVNLLCDIICLFEKWSEKNRLIENSWDIEAVLGNIMLLPALYLQCKTGQFRYKRDTFDLWHKDFLPSQKAVVDIASRLRANLSERVIPPKALLKKATSLKRPGLIQRWAMAVPSEKKRAALANESIPVDLARQVVNLTESMRKKLFYVSCKKQASNKNFIKTFSYGFEKIIEGPYSDIPFKATSKDYQKVTNYLVERWTRDKQKPVAIYQLGSVKAPGHSDLDFIIVCSENLPISYEKYNVTSFSTRINQFLLHPPFFCTEPLWWEINAWYPAFNLSYIWGKRMPEPELSDTVRKGVALSFLVEILLTKLPEELFYYSFHRPVRVRVLINTLHSFKYTCHLAESSGVPVSKSAWKLIEEIDYFRQNCKTFDTNNAERLSILCTEACNEIEKILLGCCKVCNQIFQLKDIPAELTETENQIFSYYQESLGNYYQRGRLIRMSPYPLRGMLSLYKKLAPQLSSALKVYGQLPEIELNSSSLYLEGIKKHVAAMVQYAETMIPMGISPSKFYCMGYNPDKSNYRKRFFLTDAKQIKQKLKRSFQLGFYFNICDRFLRRF